MESNTHNASSLTSSVKGNVLTVAEHNSNIQIKSNTSFIKVPKQARNVLLKHLKRDYDIKCSRHTALPVCSCNDDFPLLAVGTGKSGPLYLHPSDYMIEQKSCVLKILEAEDDSIEVGLVHMLNPQLFGATTDQIQEEENSPAEEQIEMVHES